MSIIRTWFILPIMLLPIIGLNHQKEKHENIYLNESFYSEVVDSSSATNNSKKDQLFDDLPYTINSTKKDIKDSLLSNDDFYIDGIVIYNGIEVYINDLYDFSKINKFDIAEWLTNINVFNNDDLVESFYFIAYNRYFDNIECLNEYKERYFELLNNSERSDNSFADPFEPRMFNPLIIESSHFIVEYESNVLYGNVYPMVGVFENLYNTYVTSNGFNSPIPESGYSKLRIQLESVDGNGIAGITYGYSYSTSKCRCKIVIYNYNNNSGFSLKKQQVAAHEYFHAIQFAYNSSSAWFQEAFADWSKLYMYGYNDYNYRANNFINSEYPLYYDDTKYGAMIYPLTLYKDYGGIGIIKDFYEEYETYGYINNGNAYLTAIVNDILSENNYDDVFSVTFRNMTGYLFNPYYFYQSISNDSYYWNNTCENVINLNNVSSYSGSTTINNFCRKYYTISVPNNFIGNIRIDATYQSTAFMVLYESRTVNGINQCTLIDPVSSGTTQSYTFRSGCNEIGFAFFHPIPSTNPDNISFTVRREADLNLSNNERYYEKQFTFTSANDVFETHFSRAIGGDVIFQTTGTVDTYLTIKNELGVTLATNDDSGYSANAFIKLNLTANTTYRIYLSCLNFSDIETTKLIIVPSNSYSTNLGSSVTSYSTIYNISSSGGNTIPIVHSQYQVRMITFTPTANHTYNIFTTGDEDTYLYVLNPSDNSLIIEGYSFADEQGVDGDGNAGLYRYMTTGTTYLIIVSLYSINESSGSFALHINVLYWGETKWEK